jgi:hypothetical protein
LKRNRLLIHVEEILERRIVMATHLQGVSKVTVAYGGAGDAPPGYGYWRVNGYWVVSVMDIGW